MSSAPTNQFQSPPNLSGVNLPSRPSYLDSNTPPNLQQLMQQSGGQMPPMPPSQGGGALGFDPSSDPNFLASQQLLQQRGINVPPPQGAQRGIGSGQGFPPPSPQMPVRNLPGMPQFNPNMKPGNMQMPSQTQLGQIGGNITDLINRAIASKQLMQRSSQT